MRKIQIVPEPQTDTISVFVTDWKTDETGALVKTNGRVDKRCFVYDLHEVYLNERARKHTFITFPEESMVEAIEKMKSDIGTMQEVVQALEDFHETEEANYDEVIYESDPKKSSKSGDTVPEE